MAFAEAAGDDGSHVRLLRQVVLSAAEEYVDVDAKVRFKEALSRLRLLRLHFGVEEGVGDVVVPFALEFIRPIDLEIGRKCAVDVADDVACAASCAPVDRHFSSCLFVVVFTESLFELIADGFVVWRDDDELVCAQVDCLGWFAQNQWNRDDNDDWEER